MRHVAVWTERCLFWLCNCSNSNGSSKCVEFFTVISSARVQNWLSFVEQIARDRVSLIMNWSERIESTVLVHLCPTVQQCTDHESSRRVFNTKERPLVCIWCVLRWHWTYADQQRKKKAAKRWNKLSRSLAFNKLGALINFDHIPLSLSIRSLASMFDLLSIYLCVSLSLLSFAVLIDFRTILFFFFEQFLFVFRAHTHKSTYTLQSGDRKEGQVNCL